jgi:putative pyruvate formate lyase activating enzyme
MITPKESPVTEAYRRCRLCPNFCEVDRLAGQKGRCGERATVRIAWSGLHKGEEPPVTGEHGSGMIFFSGCPLHCAYCQNYQISNTGEKGSPALGLEISIEELAQVMMGLQEMGAANLNLVTGTHFIPSIIEALLLARAKGLTLDVVWNSSGFESIEGLTLIDPYINLYLIDVKTLDEQVGAQFCGLALYAHVIKGVMEFLKTKKAKTGLDASDRLRGMLVRHLVFPETLEATKEVLTYFAHTLKDQAYLSLMVQFEPPKGDTHFPPITEEEYESLLLLLEDLGIEEGFVQELGENISWIPDFTQDNPFPESFAQILPYFLQLKRSRSR